MHRRFILIDEIGEGGELARGCRDAEIAEEIVARHGLLPRARAVDAPDRPHAPRIGEVRLYPFHRRNFGTHRVEALAVLTEGDGADEALIIEREALASRGQRQGRLAEAKLRA